MLIDLPVDNPETLEDLLVCLFDEDKYGKDESLGKCTIPVQVLRTAITSGQTQVINSIFIEIEQDQYETRSHFNHTLILFDYR